MALFQRRRRVRDAADAPLGLIVPARCINSEELVLRFEMHRSRDGVLAFFTIFEDEEGEFGNASPKTSKNIKAGLQEFMTLAGLSAVPTMDQVQAIKADALARLEIDWGPLMAAARAKGADI